MLVFTAVFNLVLSEGYITLLSKACLTDKWVDDIADYVTQCTLGKKDTN